MIDLYLLEELVAFKKYGTLAAAAKHLNISQPAMTRGIKKLEEELELKLVYRKPNRIELTKTGEFAAEKATALLEIHQNFQSEVHQFDRTQTQLTICSSAPGPLILLKALHLSNIVIDDTLGERPNWTELLMQEQYSCIVTNHPLSDKKINSVYLGKEKLTVNLNGFTDLANQPSVTFDQLADLTFLVLKDIGIWADIVQGKITHAKFLYQESQENFDEIRNYSIFPFFTTNLSKIDPSWQQIDLGDRIPVPISDPTAEMSFYVSFLKKNEKALHSLIEAWQDIWAQAD
ncbi:MAG: LysR family transcriptional regulator [Enterococcus sp.]